MSDNRSLNPLPTPPAEQPALENAHAQTLWEECGEQVTMPPGGGARSVLTRAGLAALPEHLRPDYLATSGRDLRIDLLRGYFVFAMIVDHVRGQSPLYLLTGGNRFYASAAEGFILTSGFVAGLVYRRLIERDDMAALQKILARAASLFLLTIGLTMLLLPVSEMLYLPWAQGIDASNPIKVLISILTLHRTYYLVDVMLLYTLLFIVAPLAFVLLARGHAWTVLGISAVVWALFQVFPEYASLPWPIAGNYLFNFSAWQILFVGGLVLGYRQDRIPALGCRETRIVLRASVAAMLLLITMFFVIEQPLTVLMPYTGALITDVRPWLQDHLFSKVDLGAGRLVASAITFTFLFLLATHWWAPIRRAVGWLLLPLGQHALYAYTAHILVVAAIAIVLRPLNLGHPGPAGLNMTIQIGSVLFIWLLIKLDFLTPNRRTMRLWNAAPAAIAVVALAVMIADPTPTHPGVDISGGSVAIVGVEPRLPTRFGTPIPAGSAPPPPKAVPTPTPYPLGVTGLSLWQSSTMDATTRLQRYTPEIAGLLMERIFYSSELDQDMPYNIYLPPDYELANRRYPVLYMLHGGGGHRDEWLAYGLVNVADREIRTGNMEPMIIVMPQGDTGYWTDNVDDGPRWGQYISRDLVRHIETTYRTLRTPQSRAIGGLSMGGWGALHNAFLHPNIFGIVGAHSPSLRPDDGSLAILGAGDAFAKNDPVALAKAAPRLNRMRIWIDAGQDDPWLQRTVEMHDALLARQIAHAWTLNPGGHDYTYWMQHVLTYLRFYASAFTPQ